MDKGSSRMSSKAHSKSFRVFSKSHISVICLRKPGKEWRSASIQATVSFCTIRLDAESILICRMSISVAVLMILEAFNPVPMPLVFLAPGSLKHHFLLWRCGRCLPL